MGAKVEGVMSGSNDPAARGEEKARALRIGASPARGLREDARLAALAFWLGAAVFFSFAVAPSAFAVLRASGAPHPEELAGAIVGRTLAVVNVGGFVAGLLLLATAFGFRQNLSRRALLAEVAALALFAVSTSVGQWVIAARVAALRARAGGPIAALPPGDETRAAFGQLHGYSVAALGLAMLAALIALVLVARRRRKSHQAI